MILSKAFFDAVWLAVAGIFLVHPAFAKSSSKSDAIAQGVTAAVYVHPSSSAQITPEKAITQAFEEGRRLFKDLDAKSSGEVGKINKGAGKGMVKVSGPFLSLLKVCQQITDWTQGLFDVVRGPSEKTETLLVDFDKSEARLPKKKTRLDFTSIRNGYVVDRMAGVLKAQGYTDFMIQSGMISRTMGRDGTNYWRLNVPDARGSKNGLCRVSLESSSVATVNTRSLGAPAKTDLRSVTVITRNATNASALARTGLLAGRDRAHEIFVPLKAQGFGVILEDSNGKIQTIGDVTAACFEE